MDIKPLRYFIAIAKTQSFTQAAKLLGVAQPAVSMAIKKLEHDLGLTLIHRADRNIGLTDEGKNYGCMLKRSSKPLTTHYSKWAN